MIVHDIKMHPVGAGAGIENSRHFFSESGKVCGEHGGTDLLFHMLGEPLSTGRVMRGTSIGALMPLFCRVLQTVWGQHSGWATEWVHRAGS